jgi:hypothetical protein
MWLACYYDMEYGGIQWLIKTGNYITRNKKE